MTFLPAGVPSPIEALGAPETVTPKVLFPPSPSVAAALVPMKLPSTRLFADVPEVPSITYAGAVEPARHDQIAVSRAGAAGGGADVPPIRLALES